MTNRVLLDVDGVIANFTNYYLKVTEEVLGIDPTFKEPGEWDVGDALGLTEEQKNKVHNVLYAPGVALKIDPYPEAVDAVRDLSEIADVYFVTAPLDESKTWCADRVQWLKNIFGEKLGSKYILTAQKHMVAGNVFIDDRPKNVLSWKKAWPKGLPLLWMQPYIEFTPNVIRVNKWSRVISLVQHFKPNTSLAEQFEELQNSP